MVLLGGGGSLEGMASLEELCPWQRFQSLVLVSVCSLRFMLAVQDGSPQLLLQMSCLLLSAMLSLCEGHFSLWNHKPNKPSLLQVSLAVVFYRSNIKMTNRSKEIMLLSK